MTRHSGCVAAVAVVAGVCPCDPPLLQVPAWRAFFSGVGDLQHWLPTVKEQVGLHIKSWHLVHAAQQAARCPPCTPYGACRCVRHVTCPFLHVLQVTTGSCVSWWVRLAPDRRPQAPHTTINWLYLHGRPTREGSVASTSDSLTAASETCVVQYMEVVVC